MTGVMKVYMPHNFLITKINWLFPLGAYVYHRDLFIFYPIHYSFHSIIKQLNQQVTTVTTTTMYSSLENDTDFYDDFQDISSGEKRIVRVGTKIFDKTGTYITVKLYKKNKDGVFKCYQTVTLTTREFDSLADNYTKIKKIG